MKLRKLRIRQRNKWLYFDPLAFRPWLREPVDIAGIPFTHDCGSHPDWEPPVDIVGVTFNSVYKSLLDRTAHSEVVFIPGKPGTTMSKTLMELVEALK